MIKSVLCAIDISDPESDRPVLRVAAKLAAAEGASLDVMTVVPDYGMSMVGAYFDKNYHKKVMDEARSRLNALITEELGDVENAKIRHIVADGRAYEEILKTAAAANSDLIVIGAQKPEIADYLLGPNAARVVRHSQCSVYVVR